MSSFVKTLCLLTCGVVALVGIGLSHVSAQGPQPKIDPQAKPILEDFAMLAKGMQGFSTDIELTAVIEEGGQVEKMELKQQFSGQRPNMLRLNIKAPDGTLTAVSDGSKFSTAADFLKKYSVSNAPADWNALSKSEEMAVFTSIGTTAPISIALLSDDPLKELLRGVVEVTYGGLVKLDGRDAHLLNLVGEPSWKMWFATGKNPLPVQAVPDTSRLGKTSLTVAYKNWEVNPKFGPDAFVFTPPVGARKVKSIFMEEEAPSPLLGVAAPATKLPLVDGGQLDLASMAGKNIVILDFWATWCGPCVQAMPIIDAVAEKFHDQGVRLFAVNIQEDAEQITKFLKEKNLDVTVAMDADASVAKSYLVNGIPQTVIIGKDGTVQVVQIGMSASLEEKLTTDLQALLAGKNVAAETWAQFKDDAAGEPATTKPAN